MRDSYMEDPRFGF